MIELNPKVSIIIPVYNGANYLRNAIDSALEQTYSNIEVLVINDGSNDGGATEAITISYGKAIRYFKKTNGGVASALNYGITKMKGEYFAWLSHDDVFYPEKIKTQVAYLKILKNETVALYSDYEYIDYKSKIISRKILKHVEPHRLAYEIIKNCPVHGSTVLIHKQVFDKIGMFDVKLRVIQDFDMWFRIAGNFDFIHQPRILSKVRLHGEQGIENFNKSELQEVDQFFFCYLKNITDEKIKIQSGEKSSATAYATLAVSHKRRRISNVSVYASRQAKKRLLKDGIVTIIINLIYIAWCDACNFAFIILKKINSNKYSPAISYRINGLMQRFIEYFKG